MNDSLEIYVDGTSRNTISTVEEASWSEASLVTLDLPPRQKQALMGRIHIDGLNEGCTICIRLVHRLNLHLAPEGLVLRITSRE